MKTSKVNNPCYTFTILGLIVIGLFAIFNSVAYAEAATEQKPIIIKPSQIQNLTAYGNAIQNNYPEYVDNYPPKYLFDNLVNTYSFWTEQGTSGFDLILKEKLKEPV